MRDLTFKEIVIVSGLEVVEIGESGCVFPKILILNRIMINSVFCLRSY